MPFLLLPPKLFFFLYRSISILSNNLAFSFHILVLTKCSATASTTIKELKVQIQTSKKISVHRQALKLDVKGKTLSDSDTIDSLDLRSGSKIYLRDLGPQIGWSTVFLAEYAGPLVVYLWVYTRPWIFYGVTSAPMSQTAQ